MEQMLKQDENVLVTRLSSEKADRRPCESTSEKHRPSTICSSRSAALNCHQTITPWSRFPTPTPMVTSSSIACSSYRNPKETADESETRPRIALEIVTLVATKAVQREPDEEFESTQESNGMSETK
ncbi:MAG: hypothetical protein R6U98_29120, partial [Pirellulaceae bacterium]